MIYKGYTIYAHVEANNVYLLDDDGHITAFSDTVDHGNVVFYTATQSDIGKTLTNPTLDGLKSAIDLSITPPPPAHAHGNTYYRSLYLREADKVATLQKTVDTFANRVIIAETEVTMLRDQLAQYHKGHDL